MIRISGEACQQPVALGFRFLREPLPQRDDLRKVLQFTVWRIQAELIFRRKPQFIPGSVFSNES